MTNKEKYLNLCKTEDSICLYDQPWWLDAVCGSENWDVLLYESNGEIIGTFTYYIKEKFGIKYITQPEFTQHNGLWIKYPNNQSNMKRVSLEKEVINNLIEQLECLPVAYYQQQFSPELTNWLPFYWKGYSQRTNYTYRLNNINDLDSVFKNIQQNKRKLINKAKRSNFIIKEDLSAEEFYEHHKNSLLQRNKQISYSFDSFQRIYSAAYEHNQGKSMCVINEKGETLCAIFNVWDSKWGYDLIGSVSPEANKTGAMDYLIWNMIVFLSDKVQGYDFEGSMIEGVEQSRRHFGSIQTPYFCIKKIYSKNTLVRLAINKKFKI